MAAQALYRKWRSQTFDEVVGQEHVTLTLHNALRDGRMSHAYLLTGPRGTGKTSTARILAKALNCLSDDRAARPCNHCPICVAITEGRQLDLIEIDAASNRGIDEIRDLREKIGFRPNEARYKVYIIDEVHMLTKEAFNALLKTLEEPPEHAVFVLATTEPDRVPETVRSRCQRFDFRRIPTAEIVAHLQDGLAQEGARADEDALVAIARRSTGSMRDAISLLDQLLSYGDEVLTLDRVEGVLGLVDAQTIGKLVDHLARGDTAAGLGLINAMVSEGVELGQLVDQVVAYLRAVLVVRVTRAPDMLDLPRDAIDTISRQAESMETPRLLQAIREFIEARTGLRDQVPGVPQLPIELAFLRAVSGVAPSAAQQPGSIPVVTLPAVVPATGGAGSPPGVEVVRKTSTPKRPGVEGAAESVVGTVAEKPEPAASSPESAADLLQLAQRNWDQMLAQAGKRCGMKVQAALRSVKGLEAAGHTLTLHFSHAFARDLVNDLQYRTQVEELWKGILGRSIRIRCVLPGEASPAPPAPGADEDSDAPGGEDPLLHDARNLGAVVRRMD